MTLLSMMFEPVSSQVNHEFAQKSATLINQDQQTFFSTRDGFESVQRKALWSQQSLWPCLLLGPATFYTASVCRADCHYRKIQEHQ